MPIEIANVAWDTLDDIEVAISEVLKPFWEDVKRVWSLLGNTWLTRGVIVFLQRRIDQLFSHWQTNHQWHTDYG